MSTKTIIYEQPLNELIRVCLRLEHLFKQLDVFLQNPNTDIQIQTIIRLTMDILNTLDRPDLKSKLSKEFNRHVTTFLRLKKNPGIDKNKLADTLKELQRLKNYFINTQGKIAQPLRTNEFLTNIRHSLLSPGGDSCIDAPGYFYWLNLPIKTRQKQICVWLSEFQEIRSAIELLLQIVRNSSEPQELIAEKGFYYETLSSKSPCQLIRVAIPKKTKLFPEISVSRYRINVRFIVPCTESHPKQTDKNIKFQLTKCVL
jgi:cell division protein ZapD